MADFSFPTLTTAVVGVTTTVAYQVQATNFTFTINFTQNQLKDFSLNLGTASSGWLTGRRPQSGQLYPRGVYNK